MDSQEKDPQEKIQKSLKKSQKNHNPDLKDVAGSTYQEHMKRREHPNISIEEKYKEIFTMPKPLDGSSME